MQFCGISQDGEDETRSFISENGIVFPVLMDSHPYPVSSDYELSFVPTFYFVDQDGTIRIADFGFSKLTLNAIAGFISVDLEREASRLFGEEYEDLPDFRPG